MYDELRVCTYVFVRECICTYVCMCVCVCMCMYACVYVRVQMPERCGLLHSAQRERERERAKTKAGRVALHNFKHFSNSLHCTETNLQPLIIPHTQDGPIRVLFFFICPLISPFQHTHIHTRVRTHTHNHPPPAMPAASTKERPFSLWPQNVAFALSSLLPK